MTNVSYIITNSGIINVVLNGAPTTVATDHTNYNKIVTALREKEYDLIDGLINLAKPIEKAIEHTGSSLVSIKNGLIYYNGFIVDNTLTRRILSMIEKEYPFDPMIAFLENLMSNPSADAIRELYDFMDHNQMPITEDGYMLAYKRVTEDWVDFYTHSVDNSIGTLVSMPRSGVVADSARTCAAGLHFCSLEHLPLYHGGSGRAIIIKINPKDVVSIPCTYKNAKGRCCAYTVLSEHAPTGNMLEDERKEAFTEPVYNASGGDGARLDDCEDYEDICCDCELLESECTCEDERCFDCKELIDDCECLGEHVDDWHEEDEGEVVTAPVPSIGYKPDGSAFHNVRNSSGRFTKRG